MGRGKHADITKDPSSHACAVDASLYERLLRAEHARVSTYVDDAIDEERAQIMAAASRGRRLSEYVDCFFAAAFLRDEDGSHRRMLELVNRKLDDHENDLAVLNAQRHASGGSDSSPRNAMALIALWYENDAHERLMGLRDELAAGKNITTSPLLTDELRRHVHRIEVRAAIISSQSWEEATRRYLAQLDVHSHGTEHVTRLAVAGTMLRNFPEFADTEPTAGQVTELARIARGAETSEHPPVFRRAVYAVSAGGAQDRSADDGDRAAAFIRNDLEGGADTPRAYEWTDLDDLARQARTGVERDAAFALRQLYREATAKRIDQQFDLELEPGRFATAVGQLRTDSHCLTQFTFVVIDNISDHHHGDATLVMSRSARVNGAVLRLHSRVCIRRRGTDGTNTLAGLLGQTPAAVRAALEVGGHVPSVEVQTAGTNVGSPFISAFLRPTPHAVPFAAQERAPTEEITLSAFLDTPRCAHVGAQWVADVPHHVEFPVRARLQCSRCRETHVKCIPRHRLPISHPLSAARLDPEDTNRYLASMRLYEALRLPRCTPASSVADMARRDGTVDPRGTRYDNHGAPIARTVPATQVGLSRSISSALRRR